MFLTVENSRITSCNSAQDINKIHVVGCMKRNNTSFITKYIALNDQGYFDKLLKESNEFVLCTEELLEETINNTSTITRSFECHLLEKSNKIRLQMPFEYFDTKTNEFY